jgi:hypothetical protein
LELGTWDFFGVWSLMFGVSIPGFLWSLVLGVSLGGGCGDAPADQNRRSEFPKFILRGYGSLLQSVYVL